MNNLEKQLASLHRPPQAPPLITADTPDDKTLSQKYREMQNKMGFGKTIKLKIDKDAWTDADLDKLLENSDRTIEIQHVPIEFFINEEKYKKFCDDIIEHIYKTIEENIKEIVDSKMQFSEFYTGEQGKEHFKRACHDAGIPDTMTDSMITEIKQ